MAPKGDQSMEPKKETNCLIQNHKKKQELLNISSIRFEHLKNGVRRIIARHADAS